MIGCYPLISVGVNPHLGELWLGLESFLSNALDQQEWRGAA
jgi:hypothetical protein